MGQLKRPEVINRLKKILSSLNLPTKIPENIDISEMITTMLKDKKKSDSTNSVEFVSIVDIGLAEPAVRKIAI